MYKIIIIFISAVTLFNSCFSWGNPPLNLYRVDSRSPDVIFSDGFWPRGANTELLLHVIGDTLRNGTNGLISATDDINIALRIADGLIIFDDETQWIYTIVPDISFVDINDSLVSAVISDTVPQNISLQSLGLYRTFGWQQEYAGEGHIPSNLIRRAQLVRRVTHADGTQSAEISPDLRINPGFVPQEPAISGELLVPTRSIENFPVEYYGDLFDHPIGGAFIGEGCDGRRSGEAQCHSISYKEFNKLNSCVK